MGEVVEQLERLAAHRAAQVPVLSIAPTDELTRRRVRGRAPFAVAIAASLVVALGLGVGLLAYASNDSSSVHTTVGRSPESAPAWVITPSPNPDRGNNVLSAVSCPDVTHCVALTGYSSHSRIVTLADGRWSVTPGSRSGDRKGVSCPDATHCVVVGDDGTGTLIETLSNGTWSVTPNPNPSQPGSILWAVSCSDATHCVAVGHTGEQIGMDEVTNAEPLIMTLSDGTWSIAPSPNPGGAGSSLRGVSCSDATHCVAVGGWNNGAKIQTLVETLSDGTWSITSSANPGRDGFLRGVSCSDATHCVAVGDWNLRALVETLSDGGWSVTPSPSPGPHTNELSGVSCSDAAHCVAVGQSGGRVPPLNDARTLIGTLTDGAWSVTPSPNRGTQSVLFGVACPDISSCVAVGGSQATRARTLIETTQPR